MAAKPEPWKYRIVSRLEVPMPAYTGVKGPMIQVTWEFPGHVPRVMWFTKDDWSEEKEKVLILEMINRIKGREATKVT